MWRLSRNSYNCPPDDCTGTVYEKVQNTVKMSSFGVGTGVVCGLRLQKTTFIGDLSLSETQPVRPLNPKP